VRIRQKTVKNFLPPKLAEETKPVSQTAGKSRFDAMSEAVG
jgi:hypothetical protein